MREPADDEEEHQRPTPKEPLPRLPTVDDEAPPKDIEYRDWSPDTTKVVSGPIGPAKKYPGQMFMSRGQARAYWLQRAGRIIEDLSVPGRWIYRVRKDA